MLLCDYEKYVQLLRGWTNHYYIIDVLISGWMAPQASNLLAQMQISTALDVVIQAQIINLFKQIKREYDVAVIFITHDLSIIGEIADKVAVMYAGKFMNPKNICTLKDLSNMLTAREVWRSQYDNTVA